MESGRSRRACMCMHACFVVVIVRSKNEYKVRVCIVLLEVFLRVLT